MRPQAKGNVQKDERETWFFEVGAKSEMGGGGCGSGGWDGR